MLGVVIVIILSVQKLDCIPWPLQTATGCFGNTHDDFLTPFCNTSHVIAVSGVFAMVKERTTNCPVEAEIGNRDEEKCCRVASEDCKMVYSVSGMPYYSECSGLETCRPNVANDVTSCNTTTFLDTSNYMLMEFYCIARSLILKASSTETGTKSGTAVYVQNQGYPKSSEIGGSCTVASSCNTTIVLTVIHLNLNNSRSGCSQHLNITDGRDNHIIDCSHNNHGDSFPFTDVYTSIDHFLVLDFSTVEPGTKGQLWIEVRGSNPYSTMDLRCGSSAVSAPLAVDECPANTTTTALTATPLSQTLSPSERKSTILRNTTQNWIRVLIVVVVLLVLMILFAGILEYRSRRKNTANKVHASGNIQDNVHHGLPVYACGPEPELIPQIAPTRGVLSEKQSTRETADIRTTSYNRVPPEIRRFGDAEMQAIPRGGLTLPPVRQPPQPPRSVDLSALTSQGHAESSAAAEVNGHVGNNTAVEEAGQSEQIQTKRKRKKMKRKKDKTNEDEGRCTEGEKLKRKKKKTKKTLDYDAEKEL